MDWWAEVRLITDAFLDRHGLLAAFVFLLIEEAGVPIPIPGDFMMLVLGVQASQGRVSLVQAILVMQAATMLGATILYGVARWGGRTLVYRYGHYIRLHPQRLDRAEVWLQRRGFWAVFFGRLVPGLRIVTAVACGVFAVPFWVYFPAMSLGALVYIVAYALLGYLFGPPVLHFLERLHLPLGLVGSAVLLALLVAWLVRARRTLRRHATLFGALRVPERGTRLRAGAVAGIAATLASTLGMNVLLNLAGNLAFHAPGALVERTALQLAAVGFQEVHPIVVFVALPAYVLVGVLWGALYGLWKDWLPEQPDWRRGTIFALLPLAVSLLLVMPALGLGFLGSDAAGPLAALGELLRHLVYGLVLGVSYPVFLVRRVSRRASAER